LAWCLPTALLKCVTNYLLARGIHVVRIIARVELSNIIVSFHRLVNVVVSYTTFDVVYETVSVGIHNFAFITMHRWHILVVKFIRADFFICQVYTYSHKSASWTLSQVSVIQWLSNFLKKWYDCENLVSRSLPTLRTILPISLIINVDTISNDFPLFCQIPRYS